MLLFLFPFSTLWPRKLLSSLPLRPTLTVLNRYCLTHSPVPIIVVRPERKVRKAVEKRRADPKRGTHFDE